MQVNFMEENKKIERKVIRISRKKLIWGAVILLVLLIVGWIVMGVMMSSFGSARSKGSLESINSYSSSQGILPEMMGSDSSNYYREQNQNPSITDTREFLKTSYSSTLKTRDVSGVATQVKNTIKAADGRVDNFYSSEKYGRISFVVAKSKFEAFKSEIEGIVHKKLYTESISSENLLGQKQNIEGQLSDANQSLDSLIAQRTEAENNHNKIVASINKELKRIESELSYYRTAISTEKDISLLNEIRKTEKSLVQQQTYQKKILGDENINYASTKQNFDAMISNAGNNITDINKQDGQLLDNVETVNGYVAIEWTSLWEMARIFSPIHPTLVIIILIILSIVLFRRRLPKVVIE